jgi:hypothetical protein
MQDFLKMLIHHVDHPVTKSPQGKQQNEEEKGEENVLAVVGDKHAFFGSFGGVHFGGTFDD